MRRPMTLIMALTGACVIGLLAPLALSPDDFDSTTFGEEADIPADGRAPRPVRLPNPARDWDYQIGAAFAPAGSVRTVARDRQARPAQGAYNVCYINAFQTQPNERAFWRQHPAHWALVIKKHGRPVVDSAWGEFLLDLRTPARRSALARIVGRWIDGCARSGFDAVELDNLDSWSRSYRLVSRRNNIAFARLLTARAHRAGLAVAQKNWAELSPRGRRVGFDFAVAEECARWHECFRYARAYDDRVLVVEYRGRDFRAACRRWGERVPVVLRDRAVSRHGINRRC